MRYLVYNFKQCYSNMANYGSFSINQFICWSFKATGSLTLVRITDREVVVAL